MDYTFFDSSWRQNIFFYFSSMNETFVIMKLNVLPTLQTRLSKFSVDNLEFIACL